MTTKEKTAKKRELRKQKSQLFEKYRTNQISLEQLKFSYAFIDGEMSNYN